MATTTPGGVIRGDWATGRDSSAAAPTSGMATLSTVAKIGRSMKKRDSMAVGPAGPGPTGGPGASPRGRAPPRRLAQRRHGRGRGLDLHVRADWHQPADEDPVVRLQAPGNHAQAVLLKRPGRDPAGLDLV